MLTISAKQFNQLTPAQQLAALRATVATKRTRNARWERQVHAMQRRQQQRDAMIADTLTFCPEFLDGSPL
jgi:hypothetical protein